MTCANIPQGSPVFLDANTLIYHASADPNLDDDFDRVPGLKRYAPV